MHFQTNSVILERKEVAKDAVEISFTRPVSFSFEAGQYSQIIIPELLWLDPRGFSRLFSIASSPNDKSKIVIILRISNSGYKRTLVESQLGKDIFIRGPFGKDFLLPKESRPVVFVAGGIGITPFLSMINFVTEEKTVLPITLLYANRSKESAVYMDNLESIAENNKKFVLRNKLGPVDKGFLTEGADRAKEAIWYVAGPPGMVESSLALLAELGIDKANIRKERFTGY